MALSDQDVGALKCSFTAALDDDPKVLVATGQRLLYGWMVQGTNAAVGYVQVFDAAAIADVTLGTTVPDLVITTESNAIGAGSALSLYKPIKFAKGIVIASTTTATGSTGVTNDTIVNLFYA